MSKIWPMARKVWIQWGYSQVPQNTDSPKLIHDWANNNDSLLYKEEWKQMNDVSNHYWCSMSFSPLCHLCLRLPNSMQKERIKERKKQKKESRNTERGVESGYTSGTQWHYVTMVKTQTVDVLWSVFSWKRPYPCEFIHHSLSVHRDLTM